MAASRPDIRKFLTAGWEQLMAEHGPELEAAVLESWKEALAATKGQKVKGVFECRGCGKQNLVEVPVQVPDILTRAKVLEIFANQTLGSPEQKRVVEIDVGERTLEALGKLSTLELARIASTNVVDGDWRELEPGEDEAA